MKNNLTILPADIYTVVNKTILNGNILKVLSATETPYIQWKGDGKPEAKRKEYYNKQYGKKTL